MRVPSLKIIPAIDLMDGKCVRLTQGRFEAKTIYSALPEEMARRFRAAGARSIHVVDLDGAKRGELTQTAVIARLVEVSGGEVQVGGGIRTRPQVEGLLGAGVSRIVLGSLAVTDPRATEAILELAGPDRVTIALDFRRDAQGTARVAVRGWQEEGRAEVTRLLGEYSARGVRHFLCTDIDRDGTLAGPDVALYRGWQGALPEAEIQVSGGIGSLADLKALRAGEARAVIIGKSLYEGRFTLPEALSC